MKQRYHWLRWMYYEGTLAFKGATNASIWLKLKRASWMVGIMDLVFFFFFFFLSFMTHQSPMTLEPPRNPSWKWAVVRVVNGPSTHLIRVLKDLHHQIKYDILTELHILPNGFNFQLHIWEQPVSGCYRSLSSQLIHLANSTRKLKPINYTFPS